MSEIECRTCGAWDTRDETCRRRAPGPGGFPVSKDTDWCLEWEAKRTTSPSLVRAAMTLLGQLECTALFRGKPAAGECRVCHGTGIPLEHDDWCPVPAFEEAVLAAREAEQNDGLSE